MKRIKKGLAIVCAVSLVFSLCGCWNYRSLEDLEIVAGVAIDKGEDGEGYELTLEIINAQSGVERNIISVIKRTTGKTLFQAVRNSIAISGKKLYWSHTKAIVICREIAEENIANVLDFLNRDVEIRQDVDLFIAKEQHAKDIFLIENPSEIIISYDLQDSMKNEKSLSQTVPTKLWEFVNNLMTPGITPVIPTVQLFPTAEGLEPKVEGVAVFNGKKLSSFLDGEQSKHLMFMLDKIEGGILVYEVHHQGKDILLSLEIFNNKTHIKPKWTKESGSLPEFDVLIEVEVGMDEIMGDIEVVNEAFILETQQQYNAHLKRSIENTIRTVQLGSKCDCFGLGAQLYRDQNKKWKQLESDWPTLFSQVKVNVNPYVVIRNSAYIKDTLQGRG